MNRYAMLHHHLSHNHFPPVSDAFIDPAIVAIEIVQQLVNDAFPDEQIEIDDIHIEIPDLPVGGTQLVPLASVMDGLHLWDFIDRRVEDFDEEEGL
jgi:hypothetical protein